MKILVFDTETTGLPFHESAPLERQPKIIEFGALLVDADTGETVAAYERLFNPGEPLEAVITKITGLTDEDLAAEDPFDLDWVFDAVREADGILAHNLPFDAFLLQLEARRAGREINWPRIMICSAQEYTPIFGYRPKMKELYELAFSEPLPQTHRALDDVDALNAALNKLDYWNNVESTFHQNRVYIPQELRAAS